MKNTPLIVVLVLIVLVGGAFLYKDTLRSSLMGSYGSPTPQSVMYQTPSDAPAAAGEIVTTQTSSTKGEYLVGPNGMTLYIFDKDKLGVSNCYGGCATLWPPYTTATAPVTLPANVTTVNRTDGSIMYAYKGLPLYYYTPDKQPGDLTGDGVGGVWHLVKP